MKKFIAAFLSALLFLLPVPAFCSETETRAETGTGDTVSVCQVSFSITDETGEYPDEALVVCLTDLTGTYSDSYDTPIGGTTMRTLTAPAAYSVSFPKLQDGFSVITTSGRSEDLVVSAPSEGNTLCEWSIVKTGDIPAAEETEEETPDAVFQSFVDSVSFISDDPEWSVFLSNYDVEMTIQSYGQKYASTVSGGTMEEWEAMSPFERFIWMETYVRFAAASQSGNLDRYYGSPENFSKSITSYPLHFMKYAGISDYSSVEEAYLKLAEWQYDYVQENGYPYNLVENRSYMDELAMIRQEEEETEETEQSETLTVLNEDGLQSEASAEREAESNREEETEAEAEEETEEESGTVNVLPIGVLLVVVVLALFGVLWFRKRRNEG